MFENKEAIVKTCAPIVGREHDVDFFGEQIEVDEDLFWKPTRTSDRV